MWYQVPEAKPKPAEALKPIFPWEQQVDRPKATRVFAEDLPPPKPAPSIVVSPVTAGSGTHPFSTVHYEEDKDDVAAMSEEVEAPGLRSLDRVSSPKAADQQWQDFQQNSANAWDSVPGIDHYVRAILDSQAKRGKSQVTSPADVPEEISSPRLSRASRKESLILTDFPSAVERPSLPVTPAPIARPTFWGEERDEQGELPPAEGVPEQQDWVCPQCGFSSVSASDFQRSRDPCASIVPVATVGTTPQDSIVTESTVVQPVTSAAVQTEDSPKVEAALPTLESDPPKTVPTIAPPQPRPRSGQSSHGAPLASLTDPSLLATDPKMPAFDLPARSSSITSSASALP